MTRKFLTPIDLAGLELTNARLQNLASAPSGLGAGDRGRVYVDSASGRLFVWNGSAFELHASDSDLLGGQNSAFHLDRTNQTGTQTASTISDLAAVVQAYRLDQFADATSPIVIPDGTAANHAATKGQLDSSIASLTSGQVPKGSVRAAAAGNISTTSAPSTIDGITPSAGDVFLLTAQSTGSENGPWTWNGAGSAMTRATNWDTNAEAVLGSYWIVREGTRAEQFALLSNDTAITLGTDTPAFAFISGGASYTAGDGLTLSGGAFAVGAGTGISVSADAVSVDTGVVGRKVSGAIPASTSGIFSVSGSVVTINHGLNNWSADLTLRYFTSPGSGNTQGARIEADDVASDANNIVLTLPAAPTANQYFVSIVG